MLKDPEIRTIEEKSLVGCRLEMSFADNRTSELWKTFMPRRNEIHEAKGDELYSVQIFPSEFDFKKINPDLHFVKWAAKEVNSLRDIPAEMDSFILPGGRYAVFHYRGSPSNAPKVFGYIFGSWLLGSGYQIDDRPHFEVLGLKYKNDSPDSEEEIWIPLKAD